MAVEETKKPPQLEAGGGAFTTFALEDEEDNRKLKWALIIAAVLHGVLFLVRLPDIAQAAFKTPEKPKVYVVQQVRFKPPPPQQQEELLKPRAKKVPIPDPTPDEPEPIRIVEEVQQDLDIPVDDAIFGIPDGPPAAEPDGPILVGGDVKPPERVFAPQPTYTEIARKARIQGVVIVQAIIDREGNVTNVKVLKGLPMGLEEAAVEAMKQWKFKPATLNGRPVTVYYNLTVNFKLQ
ncbi:MAG: TonB family protein [Thermoanaerobaculia bacterium]|nr:TonB family protein [Thermoanaerobaculia bacterium]